MQPGDPGEKLPKEDGNGRTECMSGSTSNTCRGPRLNSLLLKGDVECTRGEAACIVADCVYIWQPLCKA